MARRPRPSPPTFYVLEGFSRANAVLLDDAMRDVFGEPVVEFYRPDVLTVDITPAATAKRIHGISTPTVRRPNPAFAVDVHDVPEFRGVKNAAFEETFTAVIQIEWLFALVCWCREHVAFGVDPGNRWTDYLTRALKSTPLAAWESVYVLGGVEAFIPMLVDQYGVPRT